MVGTALPSTTGFSSSLVFVLPLRALSGVVLGAATHSLAGGVLQETRARQAQRQGIRGEDYQGDLTRAHALLFD